MSLVGAVENIHLVGVRVLTVGAVTVSAGLHVDVCVA